MFAYKVCVFSVRVSEGSCIAQMVKKHWEQEKIVVQLSDKMLSVLELCFENEQVLWKDLGPKPDALVRKMLKAVNQCADFIDAYFGKSVASMSTCTLRLLQLFTFADHIERASGNILGFSSVEKQASAFASRFGELRNDLAQQLPLYIKKDVGQIREDVGQVKDYSEMDGLSLPLGLKPTCQI